MRTRELGHSLLELVVTVTITGLTSAFAGAAFVILRPPIQAEVLKDLVEARSDAILQGHPAFWTSDSETIVFFPDGSSGGGIVTAGDHRVVVDRLTGAPRVIP
jgi:Tfp pilus assembly protein FimT